ncbi:hypothetical protein [Klebsiella pneumoniae]|uniref:hypothetical protein n=1 Tax=Klebsiella pneumoniae TaxID=573 RepID=UPI001D0DBEE1|nr:hypothetical protein [Klebsiella pneumoniae]
MMKINIGRGIAADFQTSGINRRKLCAAVIPEYLPSSGYCGAECDAIAECLRLRERVG